jgi:hypothetical protein
LAVPLAANAEAMNDGIRPTNPSLEITRRGGMAAKDGEARMAHRNSARVPDKDGDVMPVIERLRYD